MKKISYDDQLSFQEWDDFVKAHPNGNIFQTKAMFDVYLSTENYHPIITSLADPKTGNITGILSGAIINEMSGLASLFSSHAVIQGGPLILHQDDKSGINSLVSRFDKKVGKGAIYSDIRNMWEVGQLGDHIELYDHEDHLNFLINLEQTVDGLWDGLHKNRKKNIKKADEQGVYVEEMRNLDKIDVFYDLIKETYNDVGIPVAPRSLFVNAFSQLVPKDYVKFFLAYSSEECIGARAVLTYNGMIYDWYAGASKAAQSYNPNDYLVWHILKWGANNGYSVFDFGGAGHPDRPYGPREFKRRFGGKMVNFGRYVRVYSPLRLKLAKAGLKIYHKF